MRTSSCKVAKQYSLIYDDADPTIVPVEDESINAHLLVSLIPNLAGVLYSNIQVHLPLRKFVVRDEGDWR